MNGGYYRRVGVTRVGNVDTVEAFSGANHLASTYDVPSGQNVSEYVLGLYTSSGKLVRILFQGIKVPDTPDTTHWENLDIFSHAVHQPMAPGEYYDTYQVNELLENALRDAQWGDMSGDIEDQTDLQNAAKQPATDLDDRYAKRGG